MKRRCAIVLLLIVLLSTLLGAGLVYYALYIERTDVEITHWSIKSPDWKGRPLRLVLLSDIHALPHDGAYIDTIVSLTLEQRPDAVLLLGDYLTGDSQGMPPEELAKHLQALSQLPCYAVLGNHDHHYPKRKVRDMLRSFGAQLVEGRRITLEIDGNQLDIAGLRSLFTYRTPGYVPKPQPGRPFLLLSHDPLGLRYAPAGTTAVFAGHTHGGQVCLPHGRPLVRPDQRTPWEYMAGEVWEGSTAMYVTRGVGTSIWAMRLFCRPELTVVELRGE